MQAAKINAGAWTVKEKTAMMNFQQERRGTTTIKSYDHRETRIT